MKYFTLKYHCLINASAQEVCHFHTDTTNLPRITPPSTHVTIVSMDVPMIEKSMVILDIKRLGLTTRWEMEIETLKCPHTLVDTMRKGPFCFFRHERHFISVDEQTTRMEETLTFSPPLPLFGSLSFWFLKKDMDAMFAYRHNQTQHYFDALKAQNT